MSRTRTAIAIATAYCVLLLTSVSAWAAPRNWQDNGDNPDWSFVLNWSPIGTPGSTDNIRLGNLAAEDTVVNQDFTIDTLAITNGASADTDGNRLTINGDALISGSNSKLTLREYASSPSSRALSAEDVTVQGGATFVVDGFADLDGTLSIGATGELRGFGRVDADRYFNDGTIIGTSSTDELRFNTPGGTNLFDLDGSSEQGSLSALNGSIIIDSPLQDDFDGKIDISADNRVAFIEPVTIGSGGTVNIQGDPTLAPAPTRNLNTNSFINFDGNLNASLNSAVANTKFRSGAKIGLANAADQLITLGSASSIGPGVSFTGNGQILAGSGTLTLEDSAQVAVPLQVGETAATAINGNLAIGDSIGAAEVSILDLTSRGDLEIDIAGSNFDEYDRLTTSFAANLAGDLEVTLLNGFVPLAGDSFQILQSLGSLSGQFRELGTVLPALPGNLSWEIDYDNLNGLVFLNVIAPFTADFDGDGDVDGVDLTHPTLGWQARYGNDLDGTDFLAWQQQFGSGTLSASTAVPEPKGVALVILALCGTSAFSRREG